MRASRHHSQSLERRAQNIVAFLMLKIRSPDKLFCIAHENRLNGGYARIKARLTLKMFRTNCEANELCRQGFDRCPQK